MLRSGRSVLLAVAELFVPVFDHTNHRRDSPASSARLTTTTGGRRQLPSPLHHQIAPVGIGPDEKQQRPCARFERKKMGRPVVPRRTDALVNYPVLRGSSCQGLEKSGLPGNGSGLAQQASQWTKTVNLKPPRLR